MMRARSVLALVALAAVVLTAALLFAWPEPVIRTEPPGTTLAFPGLVARLDQARRVEITHQGRTLVLAREGDGDWRLPARGGYPVDPAALHGLLAGLAGLRLLEPRTADPALLPRLGLDDPAVEGADSTLVRVLGGDGTVLVAVTLGHPILSGEGDSDRRDVYVRRSDEAGSWLAAPMLVAGSDWLDWVERGIVDVAPEDVREVESTRAGGPTVRLVRQGERLEVVAPAEHPKLDRFRVEDIGRGLSGLWLEDVAPAGAAPGTPVGEARYVTAQGVRIAVAVRRATDALWITLRAEGEGAAQDAAGTLDARLRGWAFRVDRWKEAALVPALADLAAYPEGGAAATAASTAAPAARLLRR